MDNLRILLSTESSRGELLVADKNFENEVYAVGNTTTINVPLNLDYKPQQVEELGTMRYTLDYSYNKKILIGTSADGTPNYRQELARERFNSPAKQVFLVRSD